MARATRNAGGVALARLGKTSAEIGAEVGRSKMAVGRWISGERRPSPPDRERMHAIYKIETSLWDEKPAKRPPKPAPAAPSVVAETLDDVGVVGGAIASARALQEELNLEIASLQVDREAGSATPAERTRRMRELGALTMQLAEITGQLDLGRVILKLPMWKRLETEMLEALKPFPDAAKAVAERLEAFDRVWMAGR